MQSVFGLLVAKNALVSQNNKCWFTSHGKLTDLQASLLFLWKCEVKVKPAFDALAFKFPCQNNTFCSCHGVVWDGSIVHNFHTFTWWCHSHVTKQVKKFALHCQTGCRKTKFWGQFGLVLSFALAAKCPMIFQLVAWHSKQWHSDLLFYGTHEWLECLSSKQFSVVAILRHTQTGTDWMTHFRHLCIWQLCKMEHILSEFLAFNAPNAMLIICFTLLPNHSLSIWNGGVFIDFDKVATLSFVCPCLHYVGQENWRVGSDCSTVVSSSVMSRVCTVIMSRS